MPKKKISHKKVIALTGGIGSGKSTVLQMFKKKGAKTIDCDYIVHQLLRSNKKLLQRIRLKFGRNVFDASGHLLRKRLADQIFTSNRARRMLELMVHPLVRMEITQQIKKTKRGLIVVDIPLYYESGWTKRIRPVIVVHASQTERFKRLRKKGLTMADILNRIKAQWPLDQKVRRADFVVQNNGSLKETKKQIDKLWGIHGLNQR